MSDCSDKIIAFGLGCCPNFELNNEMNQDKLKEAFTGMIDTGQLVVLDERSINFLTDQAKRISNNIVLAV